MQSGNSSSFSWQGFFSLLTCPWLQLTPTMKSVAMPASKRATKKSHPFEAHQLEKGSWTIWRGVWREQYNKTDTAILKQKPIQLLF